MAQRGIESGIACFKGETLTSALSRTPRRHAVHAPLINALRATALTRISGELRSLIFGGGRKVVQMRFTLSPVVLALVAGAHSLQVPSKLTSSTVTRGAALRYGLLGAASAALDVAPVSADTPSVRSRIRTARIRLRHAPSVSAFALTASASATTARPPAPLVPHNAFSGARSGTSWSAPRRTLSATGRSFRRSR